MYRYCCLCLIVVVWLVPMESQAQITSSAAPCYNRVPVGANPFVSHYLGDAHVCPGGTSFTTRRPYLGNGFVSGFNGLGQSCNLDGNLCLNNGLSQQPCAVNALAVNGGIPTAAPNVTVNVNVVNQAPAIQPSFFPGFVVARSVGPFSGGAVRGIGGFATPSFGSARFPYTGVISGGIRPGTAVPYTGVASLSSAPPSIFNQRVFRGMPAIPFNQRVTFGTVGGFNTFRGGRR